ncbi:aminotransferase [Priestia endophytica]|jgi:aminotransferase|uniref:Aminotransferase n=1 Tax=Priestia endophytica TaxID=135735 RepID=A0AAX1Q4V8_9BACI|nr:aminotransferase [Priestia endophytica]RAS74674.1 aromatic amino acid aminotransferase [Priestia endophytica]RAS88061.1 aromatic amino acid aminotransferase [Priestia endophytica]
MKRHLSKTVDELQPSGIRRFFDLANGMEDVISLGVGEPDFVTSWSVREASILSLEKGYTSYTANAGLLELREEIANYMDRKFDLQYKANSNIIVTVGASQALDIAMRAIVNPGEEVLIIEPSFVAYGPLVELVGGIPKFVQTNGEEDFKLHASKIKEQLTDKTKAILICSPNNPTGSVLSKGELEEIAAIAKEHDLIVLADEIYAELTYDEEYCSIASLEGMKDRTIIISGFSKGFAMTGWRLGFLCAHEDLAGAMLKVHQYAMMCAPTMAQYGALEALKTGEEDVQTMKKSYRRRRNFFVKSLNEIGLSCHKPGGAFYAFPSVKATGLTSNEFAERLLLEQKVAVVPGHVFGESGEGYVRCSYAASLDSLQEALRRMERFMNQFTKVKEKQQV